MALVYGTNIGFLTTAPTTDPSGSSTLTVDGASFVLKHTSPSTAGMITEIGWWCDTATSEINFEVGLYAANGTVVPGEAGTLLSVSRTNAKGTTAGWKVVSGLNWSISPDTVYWIGLQVGNTDTTAIDIEASGGNGFDRKPSQTTLTNPFSSGALQDADGMVAIYAVWAAVTSNIKTYNTNALANIKTINTNPIANVKSLNTNV